MSGVTGDFAALRDLRKRIASLPEVNAAIARKAAAPVSAAFQSDFAGRRSPYGQPWRTKGRAVSLEKSGRLRSSLRFAPIGTRLRFALSVPYGRFQLWRGFAPSGKAIPAEWEPIIARIATAEISAHLNGKAG